MQEKVDNPVYAKIARDLAGKIAAGELAEGEKISGRSGLAGIYRVSPETIRRAIQLLEDIDIVSTRPGSGIFVLSREQARQYVDRSSMTTTLQEIREEIRQLTRQKHEIEGRIESLVDQLEDLASRLQNTRPVYPYEVAVPDDSPFLGKTINDAKFWQNTGGTIVAIRRGHTIINSPGPYALFSAGDVLLITGETGIDLRSRAFLAGKT